MSKHAELITYRLSAFTGIQAFVAFKQIVSFPDDLVKGRLLPVDHLLPHSKLGSYVFDLNAEVLLALDVIAPGIHKRP